MTKDQLRQYRREIHALRLEIYRLEDANEVRRARATRVTTTMTDEPKGGSTVHDAMAEMVTVIADKDSEIIRLSVMIERIANDVEGSMSELSSIERVVMRCYYIECLQWDGVIGLLNYSNRQVFRIHGEALKKMAVKCS
jgi:DNA-directed RNA polymerase specialized sigma subunit